MLIIIDIILYQILYTADVIIGHWKQKSAGEGV